MQYPICRYTKPEDSYSVGSTVLKAFRNKTIREVEAGATRFYSFPHAPMYAHFHICRNCIVLDMCSVSTNGERASPAQQGFQLIGCHFPTTLDKHANILVNFLSEYQELVHICIHKCIPTPYIYLKSPDNPAAAL